MKIRSKNKSVAFIFLFSVLVHSCLQCKKVNEMYRSLVSFHVTSLPCHYMVSFQEPLSKMMKKVLNVILELLHLCILLSSLK